MNTRLEMTEIPFKTDNKIMDYIHKNPEYTLKLHKKMEKKAQKNLIQINKPKCYPRINSYCRHYMPNFTKPWMFDDNNITEYWVTVDNYNNYSKYQN